MQAILDFFTGTLNTVAWMYILLPCVAIGGVFFTIRNRGVQFTKLGASLKLAVGKAFQKTGKDDKVKLADSYEDFSYALKDGKAYFVMASGSAVKNLIMLPFQTLLLAALFAAIAPALGRMGLVPKQNGKLRW